MKPSVCELCKKPHLAESGSVSGDWLEFADYKPLELGVIGHPDGFEYFCDEHVEAARKLTHLPANDALSELQKIYGTARWQAPPVLPWWKRLFSGGS
jgi:hypothetical protein